MIGKTRMPCFHAIAFHGINIMLERCFYDIPRVFFVVDISIGANLFRIVDGNNISGISFDSDLTPPRKANAEVKDHHMGKELCHAHRLQSLHNAAWFNLFFLNIAAGRKALTGGFPIGIIGFRFGEPRNFCAGIIMFPAAKSIVNNGGIGKFPA